jgi:hypothetical protein
MDVVPTRGRSESGWSVAQGAKDLLLTELANVAAQAGIHWLKFPVWRSMSSDEPAPPFEIAELFGLLAQKGITPVGILSNPPPDLRNQFARKWTRVSEIFTMPTTFWSSSLDPVLARYSSHVEHWQLGDDFDSSFIGLNTLSGIKHKFDQIGHKTANKIDLGLGEAHSSGGPIRRLVFVFHQQKTIDWSGIDSKTEQNER